MTNMKWFFQKQPANDIALKCDDLHCQMCADTVKQALQKVNGVVRVKVNVGKKEIAVSIDQKANITSDMLIDALKPTGYIATT
ncbi:MAG TPA: copper chaperone [Cyanobacteria bacterium UBA11691]|nr:copper chaperone [Cyanobacteria bacterium UBA11691]